MDKQSALGKKKLWDVLIRKDSNQTMQLHRLAKIFDFGIYM